MKQNRQYEVLRDPDIKGVMKDGGDGRTMEGVRRRWKNQEKRQ